jgi:hypothetical protein
MLVTTPPPPPLLFPVFLRPLIWQATWACRQRGTLRGTLRVYRSRSQLVERILYNERTTRYFELAALCVPEARGRLLMCVCLNQAHGGASAPAPTHPGALAEVVEHELERSATEPSQHVLT